MVSTMRHRWISALALVAVSSLPPRLAPAQRADTTPVRVTERTLIAFSAVTPETPMDSAEAAQNAVNEFLSDYHAGLDAAEPSLRALGVRVVRRTTRTLTIVRDGRRERFVPPDSIDGPGYVLVAPGRRARVFWGLESGEELVQAAKAYFGARAPPPNRIAPVER